MPTEDLTLRAVQRQLAAMGQPEYEVGVLTKDGRMLRRTFDVQRLEGAVSWLKAENAAGGHIYVSPVRGPHNLNLIDDLKKDAVAQMKACGVQPAVVVETSPGNFQAWVKHPEALPPTVSTMAARELAREFGADLNAADYGHLGRLAGFTNRKDKYLDAATGYYPFVKLVEASGSAYDRGPEFVARIATEYRAQQEQAAANRAALAALYAGREHGQVRSIDDFRNNPKYDGDGHRIDRAYAIYALSHGVSEADVRAAIATRDLSKKGGVRQQEAYIDHTIDGARRYLGTVPRQGLNYQLTQ